MRSIARSGARVVAGASLLVVSAVVTLALAQPPRGRTPKPAASAAASASASAGAADAGTIVDNPYGGPAPTSSSPANPFGTSTAGPTPPPPDIYDGGVRLSPLNPAPNEFPDSGPPPVAVDYDKLIGDIAALRARVAAVSDNLFHSHLAVTMETDGDHGRIASLSVLLDDGIVYTAPPNFRADDATVIYEHAVAPGLHAITVDVERRDDRGDTFRTEQRSRFVVEVPNEQRLQLDVRIGDDSNMGADWKDDHEGRYDLRIRASAESKPVSK